MAEWHCERLNRPALRRILLEDGRSRRKLLEQMGLSLKCGARLFSETSAAVCVRSTTIDALAEALGVNREELVIHEEQDHQQDV